MSNLKSRVDKLYRGSISPITSVIKVVKGETVLKESKTGNNKEKVIEIVVRL